MSFIGKNQTGGSVQMGTKDGQPGVSPKEMLLLGVAGCTGVEQAIELSEEKYCSASAMMSKSAEIRSSYRILAPGAEA